MLVLDGMAKRYGTRPSALVGVTDEVKAFCIDFWAFRWGVQTEDYHRRRAGRRVTG